MVSQVLLGIRQGLRLGLGYLGVASLMAGCVTLPESAAEADKSSGSCPNRRDACPHRSSPV